MFDMAADGERSTRAAADPLNLRVPRARLELRKNFFTTRVVEHWNRVPGAIKNADTTDAFKRHYKAHRLTILAAAQSA